MVLRKDLEIQRGEFGLVRTCEEKGTIRLHARHGENLIPVRGLDFAQSARTMKYLVVQIKPECVTDTHFFLRLTGKDGRQLTLNTTLFPGVQATAVLQLQYMDASLHFPPLLPGTLKAHVNGDRMRMEEVVCAEIGLVLDFEEEGSFSISGLYLTDEMPAFPKGDDTTVDCLGQWKQKTWPWKTRSIEEMALRLQKEETSPETDMLPGRSVYGGDMSLRFEETGYFRVQKHNGRWYLVDPEGCAFFSSGVFGVYPGEPGWILGVENQFDELPDPEGPLAQAYERAGNLELYRRKFSGMFPDDTLLYAPATANLIRALGEDWYSRWARLTAARLKRWGINTLSMFSDPEFIRRSGMPYTIMLKHYPVTDRTIFREFPDVFSEEYEERCRVFARQLAPYAEDNRMIGYFLNNEPTWGMGMRDVNLGEKVLENGRGTATQRVLLEWLQGRYGDAQALSRAWGIQAETFDALCDGMYDISRRSGQAAADLMEFTNRMVERYAMLPSHATREAAPHHLNLGMRFAGAGMNNKSLMRTPKSFDVFSLNCYADTPLAPLETLGLDMPILVGEFHFGALDAGLPHPSLFRVKDQAQRGEAYERYMSQAAAHPCGVGAHYFAYNDQPLWGRYDGENYQFGLVDICNKPYQPFVDGIRRTNERIYRVMRGTEAPLAGNTKRFGE